MRLLRFPNPVNETSARLTAAGVVAVAFVAIAARQPWLVVGYLRTSAGVTERDGISAFFVLFLLLYIAISIALVTALVQWPRRSRREGPPPAPEPRAGGATDVA